MKRILLGLWTLVFFLAFTTVLYAYDFSGLGAADVGFKPQGNRFLVSEDFTQDGTSIYYDETAASASNIIIQADGTNLISFDLVDMTFSPYDADETISISITATLSGGGSATRSVNSFLMVLGNSYSLVTDMGMDVSPFDDVEELSFTVTVHTAASHVYNINFDTITLADEQGFSAGTTPTVQAHSLAAASAGTIDMDIHWQNGNGSRRIVFARQGSSGTPSITNGTAYTADANFSTAVDIGNGWRCIFKDTRNYTTISGLSAGTTYRIVVYEFDGTGGGEAYLTVIGSNISNLATLANSSAVTYDFSGLGAASGGFKPQGNRFLVSEAFSQDGTAIYYSSNNETFSGIIIQPDGTDLATFDLVDMEFSAYQTDKTMSLTISASLEGGGTATQSISNFSLINGVAFSLSHMGMDLSTFNDVTELQFDITAHGDQVQNITFDNIRIDDPVEPAAAGTTPTVQASGIAVARKDTASMEIYWQNGNGSRRIVFFKQNGNDLPAALDGTVYNATADFSTAVDIGNGWRCVAKGDDNYAVITGLSTNTDYRIVVFEYDGSGGGETYLTTAGTNVLNVATLPVSTANTYDFSNLGAANAGFKPQGNRFLVSDSFTQDGTGMYFDSSTESATGLIIRPDGTNLASFDLTDLVISPFQDDRTVSLTVTAQLSGGGTQSQTVSNFMMLNGLSYSLVSMGMDFNAFDDVTDLSIDMTVHGNLVYNVSFDSITLDDARAPGTPPTVTTQAVAGVAADSATANGSLDVLGVPTPTAHGFVWNTGGTPTLADNIADLGAAASTGSFSSGLTGLTAYTTYFVRAFATNDTGTVYGSQESFTTDAVAPTVSTQAATGITTTTAIANGTVTYLGVPSPTAHGFVWNTAGTPTLADNATDQGDVTATGAFTGSLLGLSAGTTYYVRSFATNVSGTIYGNEQTFTSGAVAPAVTTQAVSGIGANSATANGTVTDLGAPSPTAHGFVWNTTGAPTLTDNATNQGGVAATGAFTGNLLGLSANTTYYARAYATNAWGTVYGSEQSFTTRTVIPVVATRAVSDITVNSVTLNGTISTLGTPAPTAHGFVWNTAGIPTLADNSINLGSAATTGTFSGILNGLSASTTYYVRAYATNIGQTVYGNPVAFTTDEASPVLTTVTTQPVSNITSISATGNGTIAVLGATNPTAHGFVWNTAGNPTLADRRSNQGVVTAAGAYSFSMTGLLPDTTYFVRAYATITTGTIYGNIVSFTTSADLLLVTTQAASGVTETTATGNGTITTIGTTTPTSHGFVWNTTGTPSLADSYCDQGAVTATGQYSADINGLLPYTTIYIRAYASNTAGTVYGNEIIFTTLAAPTVDAGSDLVVKPDELVELDASNSTDLDGDIVAWVWTQIEGPGVELLDGDSANPHFHAPDIGSATEEILVFRLIVTDSSGLKGEGSCQVTVRRSTDSGRGSSSGGCFIGIVNGY